jgi:hypothetical protein
VIISDDVLARLKELEKKATPGEYEARIDWWDSANDGIEVCIDPKHSVMSDSYFRSFPIDGTKFGHDGDPNDYPWTDEDAAQKSAAEQKALNSQPMDDARYFAELRNAAPSLLDSVARLKEALAIAMKWAESPDSMSLAMGGDVEHDADMARIRELVGE